MAKHAKRSKSTPPKNAEANKYDKILKENLQSLTDVILRRVIKLKIDRMENLPATRVQTTKEAEPDFLKKVFTEEYPNGAILQIEFEAADDKNADAKVLQHIGMLYFKHRLPVIVHSIYLRKGKPKHITGKVRFDGLALQFEVHCLSDISFREFIDSDVPEEVLLSILANPGDTKPAEIIRLILNRLAMLRGKTKDGGLSTS